jgi:4-hydroxy-tetrahydrodipicolinate reductase
VNPPQDAAVIVLGATGRMGRLVIPALRQAGVSGVLGATRQPLDGLDLADGPVRLTRRPVEDLAPGGVLVDFSAPGNTALLTQAVRARQARLVIGTTGHTASERRSLESLATETAVVLASNFSLGINRLAQVLPELRCLTQQGFQVECVEAHHRHKRDAPSGTAMLLLEALLGGSPQRVAHGRSGRDLQRQDAEVGIHSLRLGQIVGDHSLLLASDSEVIEIRHRALDRAAFVSGVPPAVRFVQQRPPGLFEMTDVIGNEHADTSTD